MNTTAHKCSITGKLAEGPGIERLEIDLNDNVRLTVRVGVKEPLKGAVHKQAPLGEEAAEKIRKALEPIGKLLPVGGRGEAAPTKPEERRTKN